MLRVRAKYRIHESEQVELPPVRARGLVVMVHRLPAGGGIQVTAINFGRTPVEETVTIKTAPADGTVTDLLAEKAPRQARARLARARPHQRQVLSARQRGRENPWR